MSPVKPGINIDKMDRTADPGVDFNRFCNGTWLSQLQIPADKSSWGTFYILRDNSIQTLNDVLVQAAANKDAAPGSTEK